MNKQASMIRTNPIHQKLLHLSTLDMYRLEQLHQCRSQSLGLRNTLAIDAIKHLELTPDPHLGLGLQQVRVGKQGGRDVPKARYAIGANVK